MQQFFAHEVSAPTSLFPKEMSKNLLGNSDWIWWEGTVSKLVHFPIDLHHICPQSCMKRLCEGRSLALLKRTSWDTENPGLVISALEEQAWGQMWSRGTGTRLTWTVAVRWCRGGFCNGWRDWHPVLRGDLKAPHHLPGAEPVGEILKTANLQADIYSWAPGECLICFFIMSEEQVAGERGWHPQSLCHLGREGTGTFSRNASGWGKIMTLALW